MRANEAKLRANEEDCEQFHVKWAFCVLYLQVNPSNGYKIFSIVGCTIYFNIISFAWIKCSTRWTFCYFYTFSFFHKMYAWNTSVLIYCIAISSINVLAMSIVGWLIISDVQTFLYFFICEAKVWAIEAGLRANEVDCEHKVYEMYVLIME